MGRPRPLFIMMAGLIAVFVCQNWTKNVETVNGAGNGKGAKMSYDLIIHKIVILGDEVIDERAYGEACKNAQKYLDERYAGIIKFVPLASDYKENETRSLYRRSYAEGGQYSCRFGGIYERNKIRKVKVSGVSSFSSDEFRGVSFEFPRLEDFAANAGYNKRKGSGEIIYTDAKDLNSQFKPMLIVEKFNSPSHPVSEDKTSKNINGLAYKVWDDHDCSSMEYYFKDPYMNMDTSVEFIISDKEAYQVTTVNFIFNGIAEKEILDSIINSFRVKKS